MWFCSAPAAAGRSFRPGPMKGAVHWHPAARDWSPRPEFPRPPSEDIAASPVFRQRMFRTGRASWCSSGKAYNTVDANSNAAPGAPLAFLPASQFLRRRCEAASAFRHPTALDNRPEGHLPARRRPVPRTRRASTSRCGPKTSSPRFMVLGPDKEVLLSDRRARAPAASTFS